MFHFLEILDANHIAQPGSELLEPVVDCLSLHGTRTEKQTPVQIVGNTFTSLFVQRTVQPCDATEAMGLHYFFVNNPSIEYKYREQYVPSKQRFQFRVETNRMQVCEQKPT